jgi:internalin A
MPALSRRALLLFPLASILRARNDAEWITRLGGRIERDGSGEVTAIHLANTWINDTEMLDLPAYEKLQRLDLSHTRISDEGLLRLRPARNIRELELLYAEQITDLGMTAIKGWRNLKKLNVRGTRIADETLGILGELRQIEWLDIANTGVTDNGLENLAPLTNLKHLGMGRSRVSDAAAGVIRILSTLESIDLGGPRGTARNQRNRGIGPLPSGLVSALTELKELRVIKLGHSEADADSLRKLTTLPNVEKLGLEGCQAVDDKALEVLAGWKRLQFLDVQETKVTAKGVATFRSLRPQAKVLAGPFEAASGQNAR